jgi:hypothetical protein
MKIGFFYFASASIAAFLTCTGLIALSPRAHAEETVPGDQVDALELDDAPVVALAEMKRIVHRSR